MVESNPPVLQKPALPDTEYNNRALVTVFKEIKGKFEKFGSELQSIKSASGDFRKHQMEILKPINKITRIKNSMDRFNCRFDLAKERMKNQVITNYPEEARKVKKIKH